MRVNSNGESWLVLNEERGGAEFIVRVGAISAVQQSTTDCARAFIYILGCDKYVAVRQSVTEIKGMLELYA